MTAEHGDQSMADLNTEQLTPTQVMRSRMKLERTKRKKERENLTHVAAIMSIRYRNQVGTTQPSYMLTGQTVSGLASANNTTTNEKKAGNDSRRGSTANRVSPHEQILKNATTRKDHNINSNSTSKKATNTNKSSTHKVYG